jgi:hypothetical protein
MYKFTYKGVIYSHDNVNELQKMLEAAGYTGQVALELAAIAQEIMDDASVFPEDIDTEQIIEDVETDGAESFFEGIDNEGNPLN